MLRYLKPYISYKPSDLLWCEAIPSHWKIKRTKYLFRERSQKGFPEEPLLAATQTKGVVKKSEFGVRTVTASKDLHLLKLAERGDFVISLRSFEGGIEYCHERGIISPAYTILEPSSEVSPDYFKSFFKSKLFIEGLTLFVTGIREGQNIDYERLSRAYLPTPPIDEQRLIGRFIGWANSRLDRAIRAKKKVIALLNEQKQAIIHQAVTRGINSDVKMTDSGVSWIGSIPNHWKVLKLKYCISPLEQGWSPQCDAQPAQNGEWGVLKVGCVNKDDFRPQQNKKLPENLIPDPALEIQEGDILVSRANTQELLGLAAIVEKSGEKLLLCDKLFRFRANPKLFNGRFLVYLLRSKPCRVQIEASTNGASSSMQNIGQSVVKNLWVAVPPIEEQELILKTLADQTEKLKNSASRIEKEIIFLYEYRNRLTCDIVTGKLDVCKLSYLLPSGYSVNDPLQDEIDSSDVDESMSEDIAA